MITLLHFSCVAPVCCMIVLAAEGTQGLDGWMDGWMDEGFNPSCSCPRASPGPKRHSHPLRRVQEGFFTAKVLKAV